MPTYADRVPAVKPPAPAQEGKPKALPADSPPGQELHADPNIAQLQQLANARYERMQPQREAIMALHRPAIKPAVKPAVEAKPTEKVEPQPEAEAPESAAVAGPQAKGPAAADAPAPPAEGPPAGEAESAQASAQGGAGGSAGAGSAGAPATPPPAPEAPAAEAAEPEAKQGEEKEEASAEGEGGGKEEPKLPDSPKDPADDPAFQAVLATNEANAQQQAVHTDAATEVTELQGAAVLPEEAQAEEADMEGHMAAMEDVAEQQERQPFTPATFKEKLKANLDELEKQLPNDADSAEEPP